MSADIIAITMDIDWSHDDVVAWAVAAITELGVPLTVFATHASPGLDTLRDRADVDLGAHPNFNDILDGTAEPTLTARERLEAIRTIVPEARALRSHSLTQSSRLLDAVADMGFTHESNTFIPFTAGIPVRPWRHWSGDLLRVPYVFDDSLAGALPGAWDPNALLAHAGTRVVNVHPGRIFTNQEAVAFDRAAREARQDPKQLATFRRADGEVGSLWFVRRLVESYRAAGGRFTLLRDL